MPKQKAIMPFANPTLHCVPVVRQKHPLRSP